MLRPACALEAKVVEERDHVGDISVEVVRLGATRLIARPVAAMIEEDAAVAPCQRFEVACGVPEFRIATRSEMQNEWWAVALDLIMEPGPVRSCQEGHLQAPILAPPPEATS